MGDCLSSTIRVIVAPSSIIATVSMLEVLHEHLTPHKGILTLKIWCIPVMTFNPEWFVCAVVPVEVDFELRKRCLIQHRDVLSTEFHRMPKWREMIHFCQQ
jgi:hypothetical protein